MTGETGSYRFMAPEVFRHEEYDESVDVYSFSMIFYYMLRGQPPFMALGGVDGAPAAGGGGAVVARVAVVVDRCPSRRSEASTVGQEEEHELWG